MDPKLKCIICGGMVTTFFLAHNNPVCDRCHEKFKENPDVVEIQHVEPNGTSGLLIVTNITDSTITVSSSNSSLSTSSTTTQPLGLV